MSPAEVRYQREVWITGLLGAALLLIFLVGAYRGAHKAPSTSWIRSHERVTSPAGYHCWNELNSSQPDGLEKVCAAGEYR